MVMLSTLASVGLRVIGLLIAAPALLAQGTADFEGTWEASFKLPFDPQPLVVELGIEDLGEGGWSGALDAALFGPGLLRGSTSGDGLRFDCDWGSGVSSFSLKHSADSGLKGVLVYQGFPLVMDFKRKARSWAPGLHFEVEVPTETPSHIALEGLPELWLEPIEKRVQRAMENGPIIGLAMAVVIDGELTDSRSWGWSDVETRRAVTGDTLFRWGSISKSLTAVAAAKLSEAGALDLDQEVRGLVPEFPKKKHVVTSRQLLGHLGGICHYQHLPVVTRRDYGVTFPFRDPVRALDMFSAAPLIHEPGSKYSYSTHGYVLLGAVLNRASTDGYLGAVQRLIRSPLRLESLVPDDPKAPSDNRATGYRVAADGRVFDSADSNVAWKLAGGGFQSTVSDLGRFGAGLCDEYFIDEELGELLWTRQKTISGQRTSYGLGFNISRMAGLKVVAHGGAQRRTRTYLMGVPEAGSAVALMCNTEGTNLQGLAKQILKVLLDEA